VAREYRRRRDRRRGPYRLGAVSYIFLVVVTFAIYYGQSAFAPAAPPSVNGGGTSSGGAPARVAYLSFGTPTVQNATCGDGTVFPTVVVPWESSRVPLSTHDIFLEIVELLDGDVSGGPAPAPFVTASNVCAGSPPTASPTWYAVLQDPNGANVAYFSYSQAWVVLHPPPSSLPIANGSALIVVATPFLSGLSFGLCVVGGAGTAPINECAQL